MRQLAYVTLILLSAGAAFALDYIPPGGSGTAPPTPWTYVNLNFQGTPADGEVRAFTCPLAMTISAAFAGSRGSCGVNPAANEGFTISIGGTSVGSIGVSTTCIVGFPVVVAQTCATGQRLEVQAPSGATVKDLALTIRLQ